MTEAIASSIGSTPDQLESNNLDSVKIETDQKCIKISVRVSRPSPLPGPILVDLVTDRAIRLFLQTKERLEKMGYTVAPLGQPVES